MRYHEHHLHRKRKLEMEIASLSEKLKDFPAGSLICQKNGERYKYYHQWYEPGEKRNIHRKYLRNKDEALIQKLALKAFWEERREIDIRELKAIDNYLDTIKHIDYEKPSRAIRSEGLRRVISPPAVSLPEELQQWEEDDYPRNPAFTEGLIYSTTRGEKVRSKSESFIAHFLYQYGIPYRYECQLRLENEVYYPDFTIRHPVSGKEIIWEHFGMMHDPNYVNKTAQKVRTFILNGFIPNETLLMTFEKEGHPFDVQEIIDIIERWIL